MTAPATSAAGPAVRPGASVTTADPAGIDPAGHDPAGLDPAGHDPAGHDPVSAYFPTRPLRSDAARNRERLLLAAAAVFAEQGLGASVEDIAHAAGVGMGTLYRRFPTKEDLVEELVRAVLTKFVLLAEDAGRAGDGTGFEAFLWAAAGLLARHRGCLPRLWETPAEHELIDRTRPLVASLLAEAKAHGRIREEATYTDVAVILWSLRGIIETTHGSTTSAWERHLELLLVGLRPSARRLLRPAISQHQLDELHRTALHHPQHQPAQRSRPSPVEPADR